MHKTVAETYINVERRRRCHCVRERSVSCDDDDDDDDDAVSGACRGQPEIQQSASAAVSIHPGAVQTRPSTSQSQSSSLMTQRDRLSSLRAPQATTTA